MPLLIVLPFIFIGIAAAVMRYSAEQNKRAEAQNRERERQIPEQQVPTKRPAAATPRPTVQDPKPSFGSTPAQKQPVSAAKRADRSTVSQPSKQSHPEHDLCALRPEDQADPDVAQTHAPKQSNGTPLNFTSERILNGVLFSEIFGKPKALR